MSKKADEVLNNFLINQAKSGLLPDNLGLNDVVEILYFNETEAAEIQAHSDNKEDADNGAMLWFGIQMTALNTATFINQQLERKRFPIEGYTGEKITAWGRTGLTEERLEPMVSKQTVRDVFNLVDFRIDKDSLLFDWLYGSQIELIENKSQNTLTKQKQTTENKENSKTKSPEDQKRNKKLYEHLSLLEKTAKSKGIDFNRNALLCKKEDLHAWLKTKPGMLFNIASSTFDKYWKSEKEYKCCPPALADKNFFKNIQG